MAKRIGILTGGGDVPGLNAVIKTVTYRAGELGRNVVGIRRGWEGLTHLNWDDAAACLGWADEMEATVAEMRAWRRAQHGEDLSLAPDAPLEEAPFEATGEYLDVETGVVRDPADMGYEAASRRAAMGGGAAVEDRPAVAASVARETNSDYAPYGKGARGPAPGEESDSVRTAPPSEQIAKRVVATLEKCNQALSPEILEDLGQLPLALQQRHAQRLLQRAHLPTHHGRVQLKMLGRRANPPTATDFQQVEGPFIEKGHRRHQNRLQE